MELCVQQLGARCVFTGLKEGLKPSVSLPMLLIEQPRRGSKVVGAKDLASQA